MKTAGSLAAICAVAGLMMLNAPRQADARPQYLKAFTEKYEKVKEQAGEKKCLVCHGEKKTELSEYAAGLKKALKTKNVKPVEEISAGFDAVASEKQGDKTYGDLLKEGTLPEPFKAKD